MEAADSFTSGEPLHAFDAVGHGVTCRKAAIFIRALIPNPTKESVMARPPWGHVSRHCVYCGEVGPRCLVLGGYAHKRCIPRGHPDHPDQQRKKQESAAMLRALKEKG